MIQLVRRRRVRQCMSVVGLLLIGCTEVTGPARTATKPTYDGATLFKGLVLANGPAADFLSTKTATPRLTDLIRDPVQLERVSRFQDRLISAIDEVNPGFLNEFAAAMTSGSHTRIQAMFRRTPDVVLRTVLTMREAGNLRATLADRRAVDAAVSEQLATLNRNNPREEATVREVVEALYASVNTPDVPSGERPSFREEAPPDAGGGGGGGGCVYVYLAAVYVAVAINGAVVSNYVVAIAIATYLAVGSGSTPATQLARERLVNAIATTLAA